MTTEDIRDLLSLMPRAVDLLWRRGSGPVQCDEAGETLHMPHGGEEDRLDPGRADRAEAAAGAGHETPTDAGYAPTHKVLSELVGENEAHAGRRKLPENPDEVKRKSQAHSDGIEAHWVAIRERSDARMAENKKSE